VRLADAERLGEQALEAQRHRAGGDTKVERLLDQGHAVVLVENRTGGRDRGHPRQEPGILRGLLTVVLLGLLQDKPSNRFRHG
jgi:hypothetical protein